MVRRRAALLLASAATVFVLLPMGASQANPEPSTEEVKDKAERLHNEVEVLTERYNGLRIQLKDAERASKRANERAREQEAKLAEARDRVRQLAATRYMTGGVDPAIELAVSENPQAVLDRAATLHRMSQEDASKLNAMQTVLDSAERTREAATKRADEVKKLKKDLQKKKQKIEALLADTQEELLERAASAGGAISNISLPGSGKAVQAANYALSQQGVPYVWGGSTPSGFDCSGLTMWAYQQVGVSLPHYTGAQYSAGTQVSQSELRVGDLVFFYSDLHHMGMYIGGGKMVHAPHSGTVVQIAPIAGRPFAGAVRVA